MLKLMKYEFQKQMFSKLIMGIGLGVLGIVFLIFNYTGKQNGAEAMMALMALGMMISVVYAIFEYLTVYEKDLTTKQSYMLFLVPKGAKSILGAKMLSAILQIFVTFVMFGGAIALCFSLYCMKYEGMQAFFEEVKLFLEAVFKIKLDVALVLETCFELFILWVFVVMLGVFLTTVMNTVLNKNKLTTVLVCVLYFVCFWLIAGFEEFILDLNWSEFGKNIFSYAYLIGLDLVFFFGTAWLLDKKLSV